MKEFHHQPAAMIAIRTLALAAALAVLTACDDAPKPPAPVPAPPKTAPAPVDAAPPAAVKTPEPAEKASLSAPPAPITKSPEPEPDPEPAMTLRAAPPDKAPASAHLIPGAKEKAEAKAQAKADPLPPVKLDLHLPKELVKRIEPGEPLEKLPEQEPLLPPMFVDKAEKPGRYQLNGRLITDDKVDDYWRSVEGAELQIEFRN
ncbi:hypothetical protein [Pseudomonas subflava]|uniref:hypothetical protein n=1 Tax=Pseudomonas subflava TaxID=2952933 RepID=UPI002079ADE9|nr:hypothetical protein [Pseudomonas subflava]